MTRWSPVLLMVTRHCAPGARWKLSWVRRYGEGSEASRRALAAAARPSTARTKLDQALGPTLQDGPAQAAEHGTVGEMVAAYLADQCDVLASDDVGLRTGAPELHKTRVAARRLRSTLRIFGDIVDAAPAAKLNDELVWYAGVLGEVRDRDILSRRLLKQIAELPPEQVRGPVEAEITKTSRYGTR